MLSIYKVKSCILFFSLAGGDGENSKTSLIDVFVCTDTTKKKSFYDAHFTSVVPNPS